MRKSFQDNKKFDRYSASYAEVEGIRLKKGPEGLWHGVDIADRATIKQLGFPGELRKEDLTRLEEVAGVPVVTGGLVKMAAYFGNDLNIVPDIKFLPVGSRVRRINGDSTFSMSGGTIIDVMPRQNKALVAWDNGKTRQEDTLYLLSDRDLPVANYSRRRAFKQLVSSARREVDDL